MKLFIYLFLVSTSTLLAAARPHLVCLGAEEVKIHKAKDTGPYYKLNQEMISTMLQLSESIQMTPKALKEVCESESTSLKILELIFTSKKSVFTSKLKANNVHGTSSDAFSIDELKIRSFKVLINFLTRLQSNYTDPHCLKKKVPEINSFYENATHLLAELGIEKTVKTIKNPKKFFEKLRNLPKNSSC